MPERSSKVTSVLVLYENGYYRQALGLARRALHDEPHNGRLWELCGLIYHVLGRRARATSSLEAATLLVPLTASARSVLAKCYAWAGKRDLARDMYRHLLSLQSLPLDLLPDLASGLGRLGDARGALEACRRAAEGELHNGQPFYGMAHYMERLGYPLTAICAALKQAVELDPDRFQYRFALAMACRRVGHNHEAYRVLCGRVNSTVLRRICSADCITRMHAIFNEIGDNQRRDACRRRLDELEAIKKVAE